MHEVVDYCNSPLATQLAFRETLGVTYVRSSPWSPQASHQCRLSRWHDTAQTLSRSLDAGSNTYDVHVDLLIMALKRSLLGQDSGQWLCNLEGWIMNVASTRGSENLALEQ